MNLFLIPLRAKRVGEFIEISAQKNFTHPYTEYHWVSVTLSLCNSVTLWPINVSDFNQLPYSLRSQGDYFTPGNIAKPFFVNFIGGLTSIWV